MKKDAFSLIELLVVLAIIGVLVAIIIPVVQSTRAISQSVRCQANLRQIGSALTLFTSENNNILCQSAYGSSSLDTDSGANYKWMDAIFPYAPSEAIFCCPSDPKSKYRAAKNLPAGAKSEDYGSYGMNGAYRDANDAQTPPRSAPTYTVNRLQIVEPARTVWVADTNNRQEANGSFGFSWANSNTNPSIVNSSPRQLDKIIERHQQAANVLFCDGHAEKLRLETLAVTRSILDPIDGAQKNVLPIFTIEAD